MPEIRPFCVRYKRGSDKSILPGIHGRFATLAEARAQMIRCASFFGGGKKNADGFIVGRAIVGIVIDQAQLALQKQEEEAPDELGGEVPEAAFESEADLLRAENIRLKSKLAKLGSDPEDDDDDGILDEEYGKPVGRKAAKA